MQIRFSKMHGLGNDFMIVDGVTQHLQFDPATIRNLADRHTGVGFDQLLIVEPPSDPNADFRYRIYNADGSEAEQCGNGARCFARFVVENGLCMKSTLRLETNTGMIGTQLLDDGNVEVDMGIPCIAPEHIPFLTTSAQTSYRIDVDDDQVEVIPVSMGNPHAVVFVDNVFTAPVADLGSRIGRSPLFPNGVNVGFCQVIDDGFARVRVFERGVGETRACGSGACAAAVAGHLTGRLATRCKISLPGGKVRINWPGPGQHLLMSGPAALVYDGRIEL
jgi:diaminopimelate epimerase